VTNVADAGGPKDSTYEAGVVVGVVPVAVLATMLNLIRRRDGSIARLALVAAAIDPVRARPADTIGTAVSGLLLDHHGRRAGAKNAPGRSRVETGTDLGDVLRRVARASI
jgi:hypothetical protein